MFLKEDEYVTFERNYTTITNEESLLWGEMEEQEKRELGNFRKRNLFLKYPKAVRHYLSLFPNHYLDVMELRDETRLQNLTEQFFLQIDNPKANELSIMKYIKKLILLLLHCLRIIILDTTKHTYFQSFCLEILIE